MNKLWCRIFGHNHKEMVYDGEVDGRVYYDPMWSEECLMCGEDKREEPEDWDLESKN